jgi:hypothetical protein
MCYNTNTSKEKQPTIGRLDWGLTNLRKCVILSKQTKQYKINERDKKYG